MCDQIWADYHKEMNDEFCQPIEKMVQEGECEMKKYEVRLPQDADEPNRLEAIVEADSPEEAIEAHLRDVGYVSIEEFEATFGPVDFQVTEVQADARRCEVCGAALEEEDGWLSCPVYMAGKDVAADEHTSIEV